MVWGEESDGEEEGGKNLIWKPHTAKTHLINVSILNSKSFTKAIQAVFTTRTEHAGNIQYILLIIRIKFEHSTLR